MPYCTFESPIGTLYIGEENGYIVYLSKTEPQNAQKGMSILLLTAASMLREYFAGRRKDFPLPLKAEGTEFQQSVWRALLKIPYGETRSYKQVAEMAGNEKACRAVGMANHNNPIMILIPCHRVIGSDGSMTGFGTGISDKEYLLKLESEYK